MMAQVWIKNECYKEMLQRGSSRCEELEEEAAAVLFQPPINTSVEAAAETHPRLNVH